MKIAITGSHSTGKTSLGNSICQAMSSKIDVRFITGLSRNIIQRGFPLNMDANIDSYSEYIIAHLSAEKKMNNYDLFISDRTILDALAYSLVNNFYANAQISNSFISMMKEIWLVEKERYDFYIYCPIEFPLERDGIRPNDEKYRTLVDNKIQELLLENNVQHVVVHGSLVDRTNQILKLI